MTNLTRLLPLLALLVPLSIPAFAEAITVTASRNATTPLRMIWVYNRATCYGAAFPKIILRKPKNGKLSYRKTKVKVPKGKRCAGKTAYAVTVYYRPNRGFRGNRKCSVRVFLSAIFGRNQSNGEIFRRENHCAVNSNPPCMADERNRHSRLFFEIGFG